MMKTVLMEELFIFALLFLVGGGLGILVNDDWGHFFGFGALFCAVIFVAHYFVKKF